MVGSNGPRMLRIGAPMMDAWNTWFVWFENDPEQLTRLIGEMLRACDDVGRDSQEVEKTAALYVQLERGGGRIAGSETRPKAAPMRGSHEEIAQSLARFGDVGLDHAMVVLDPIDTAAVEELCEIAELVRSLRSK